MGGDESDTASGFSLPRIIEVLATASIVGGITLWGSTQVLTEKMEVIEERSVKNERNINDLRREVVSEVKQLTGLMVEIKIELARSETDDIRMSAMAGQMDLLQGQMKTIWPRLREMKERIQHLEPKDAERWQY